MKNVFKINLVTSASVLAMVFLLIYPKQTIYFAKSGLLAWFNNVIPSLFPFMVAVNFITGRSGNAGFPKFFTRPFSRIFNVNENGFIAFLFGLLSGYPLGAKIASDLYSKNQLERADVQKLMVFCSNAGPMFIVGTLSCSVLNSVKAGYIILLCSILSNVSTGIIINNSILKFSRTSSKAVFTCCNDNKKNSSAVQNSCEAVIRVGGYVVLFSVIGGILETLDVTDVFSALISNFIPINAYDVKSLLSGILEMTCGINSLLNSPSPLELKCTFGAFMVSFGGVSVIAQCADFLKDTGINIPFFVLCKLINGILTAVFTYLCITSFL